mgnify:CR=1 FL=1
MDASYKIQRGIHVHLIQFFMCPEFWVHIRRRSAYFFVEAYCFSKVKISPSRSIAMVLPS